jgi:hypothetical protein
MPFIIVYFTLAVLPSTAFGVGAVETKGLVQLNYVFADDKQSWFDNGTGILAYSDSGVNVQQALVQVSDSYSNGISFAVIANYYQRGEQNLGISQAQLRYKPLMGGKVRWRGRVGFFYPKMSLENVDLGWLSPYTYTQSAINSWIGEELRNPGVEFTVYSPGRSRRSAYSWELTGGVFKGNDPTGTILSWRGFALHDRQSLNNDSIPFAPYPTVLAEDQVFHPNYVEPFHEFDGHLGFYLGAHMDYFQKTKIRYYYYDNQADPKVLNAERLYAWRTKFHSLAVQHKVTENMRFISQWMTGTTTMGPRSVFVNYDAWYAMLSYKIDKHRVSARYDSFKVREDDFMPNDLNDSDGKALTLAWRYTLNKSWQVGVEQHFNQNYAANRVTLLEPTEVDQQQSLAVLQYRW